MKKRIPALLTAGVMALSLAACGGGSSSTSTADTATSSAASATSAAAEEAASAVSEAAEAAGGEISTEGLNMTLIMSSRDEFLSTLEAAATKAAEELGINLSVQDANSDMSKDIQYIESAVNSGDDAVIVNVVDADSCEACIEAAGDIPIIFVNRPPSDPYMVADYDNAAVVASNEDTSGYYQGEFLANYFQEQGKTDIRYILLSGQLGNYATTHRTESVIKGMEENGLTVTAATADLVADWDRATAMDMIAPVLTTEEYDCIIGNNDAMALGAVEAMEAAGLDPSSIPIVGIDCTADGAQALVDGKMAMTVFQDPVGQGKGCLIAAVNMLNGQPLNTGTDYELAPETDHVVWVPFEPVTIDNVEDYM